LPRLSPIGTGALASARRQWMWSRDRALRGIWRRRPAVSVKNQWGIGKKAHLWSPWPARERSGKLGSRKQQL